MHDYQIMIPYDYQFMIPYDYQVMILNYSKILNLIVYNINF